MAVRIRDIAQAVELNYFTVIKKCREMNICVFTEKVDGKEYKAISEFDMKRIGKRLNIKIKIDKPEPEPIKGKVLLRDAKLSTEQLNKWYEHVGDHHCIILQENPQITCGEIQSAKDWYLNGEISTKIGKTLITLKV